MTEQPRHTADTITSDALDQLYARLDRAETELDQFHQADSADAAAGSYAGRAEKAEAALARVHALRTDWLRTGAPPIGTSVARWWDKRLIELNAALDEPKEPTK